MDWLFIALLSYFLLAVLSLADKWLLSDRLPDPASYAFYSGAFGVGIFLLIPLVKFSFPPGPALWSGTGAGFLFVFFLYFLYRAVKRYEPSIIIPAVGGIVPFFTLGFLALLFGENISLSPLAASALVLLALGTVAISSGAKRAFSLRALIYSMAPALLFALYTGFLKKAFSLAPFWHVLILLGMGAGAASLVLVALSKPLRNELRAKHKILENGTPWYFAGIRALGGTAGFLQRAAVFLAPASGVPFISALQGTQYFFILLLSWGTSVAGIALWKMRGALPPASIAQRIVAMILISLGLALLSFAFS